MQKNIQNNENLVYLINKLEESYISNNLGNIELYISKITIHKDLINNLNKLFLILENNPNLDFGMPGDLIRLLESFYGNGYEEQLLISLKRKVVFYNLWMLNRIINSSSGNIKIKYIEILKDIVNDKNTEKNLRDIGKELLE